MKRDLFNRVKHSRALSPVSVGDNTAQVSQIIDMQGFSALLWIIAIGNIASGTATFAVTMDEGDAANLSDAAAVAAGDLIGTYAGAGFQNGNSDQVRKIGYKGAKRYVRLTITPSNNAAAALMSVVSVQGAAENDPQSSQS